MLKHSKMDHAKQNMDQAKYDLRNFSRELNDVNMACDLTHRYRRFSFICRLFFRWICGGLDGPGSNQYCKRQVEEAIRRTEVSSINYSVCKENGNESEVISLLRAIYGLF